MTDPLKHFVNKRGNKYELRLPPLKRFLNLFRVPYPYSLLLFTGILTVLLFGDIGAPHMGLVKKIGALFQCIATGYIAWAVIYSYSALKKEIKTFADLIQDDQEETNLSETINKQEWVIREIDVIYNGRTTYLIFVLIAIGLFSTVVFVIGNPLSQFSSIPFYVTFAFFSLIAGFGGSTVFLIGHFLVQYGNQRLSVSIFQYPYSPFRFIGQLQLKFAWITAIGYFFAASMTVLYWGIQPSTIFWLFVGIAFVIGFFIYPQLGFHKHLRNLKREAIRDISDKIQRLFEKSIKEPQTENIRFIRKRVEKMKITFKNKCNIPLFVIPTCSESFFKDMIYKERFPTSGNDASINGYTFNIINQSLSTKIRMKETLKDLRKCMNLLIWFLNYQSGHSM